MTEALRRRNPLAHHTERWDRRAIVQAFRAATTPSPSDFGSFGRSHIVPPCRIEEPEYVHVGDGVVVLEHTWFSVSKHFDDIDPEVRIGDDVRIGRGCQLSSVGALHIEPRVLIGDFVVIADTSHPYDVTDRMPVVRRPEPVRIGQAALIASHVVVLPGVTIGPRAYIDHHVVVTRDVPAGAVITGSSQRPADQP